MAKILEYEKITRIKSIADYLNALPNYEEFSDSLLDNLTLYRGQGNKNWKLIPGVMRNREDYLNEELYIKECLRQYPEEFEHMKKIDMLIKMQHYGAPTRLLDLTRNPMIALYFACASESEEDGVVYCICGPVLRSTDLYINVIAECVFNYKSHGRMYIEKRNVVVDGEEISQDTLNNIITGNFPIVFEASLNNRRIKNQNGYFAIYREGKDCKEVRYKYKILIEKEYKETMMKQLSMIGIDSKFIFPELSNGISCIVSSIRKSNFEFNKRFHTFFD